MKRIVALVTLIALMLCNGSLAYAVDSGNISTDEYGDNFVTQEEIEEGRAEGERLYKVGMGIRSGSRARASLDVRLQLQDDKNWVDKHMPCSAEDISTNTHKSHTYGSVGCAMTSYAMVLSYYGRPTTYTPVQVATKYGADACNFSSGTLLPLYNRKGSAFEATLSTFVQAKIKMKGAISEGKPVVIKLKRNTLNAYHFVVAYGYTDNGTKLDILIRDPENDIAYTSLDQYYNNKTWYPVQYVAVS